MKPIILDTCVLVAIFTLPEENHHNAKELADYLVNKNIRPKFPMHGFFEIACALKNKKSFKFDKGIEPLPMEYINIDQKFFQEYHDPGLPYIKSGDFIFLAMAKKDNAILITEDNKLYDKAIEAGIEAYKVKSFLEKYVDASK